MKKYKAVIYDIDGTILNTLNMNMYPLIRIIKEETGEVIYIGDVRSDYEALKNVHIALKSLVTY